MISCLPKYVVDNFLAKIKSGEMSPDKLINMTSEQRRNYFSEILGANNAKDVNTLFERKMILKNQQQGIVNWAKEVAGLKPEVKRDIISKVSKMTEILQPQEIDMFLEDLVAKKMGFGISVEEAGKIVNLSKVVEDKKAAIPEESPDRSPERIEYGMALTLFKDYVGDLKMQANQKSIIEMAKDPFGTISEISGATKSFIASFDNSFFGRQGIVTLTTNPDIWSKNFIKSFGDMAVELKGQDGLLPIKADVFSRENAINGKYQALGIDIGISSEEAYPSSLPEKIPLFKRIYKASQTAYNGAALRMRADLADRFIAEAEALGVNVKDKNQGIGILINSMTGRGKLSMHPDNAKTINATFFSVKFLKSQLDVLTMHAGEKKMKGFARKKAAENLVKTIGFLAAILAIAKWIDPDSVELDPRSTDFGKIMLGENRRIKINITGGMGGIVVLASRIVPTIHDGEWGFWRKSIKGNYIKSDGSFGSINPAELISNFIAGKTSPVASLLLDYWKGRDFKGDELTVVGQVKKVTVPIGMQNQFSLAKDPDAADPLLFSILTALNLLGIVNVIQNTEPDIKWR